MKPPPNHAPVHASNTAPGKNLKHGNPTQSNCDRQLQFGFCLVPSGDFAPRVMAEFDVPATEPIADRPPRRRGDDQSRLFSFLGELDGNSE